MTIRKLSQVNQAELGEWYSRAINDPTVAPWLSDGRWSSCPVIPDNDWEEAFFFGGGDALLRLNYSRDSRGVKVSLFVLMSEMRSLHSAMMIKFAVRHAKAGAFKRIDFMVSDANKGWLSKVEEKYSKYRWGICPHGLFDPKTHVPVPAHYFSIPLEAS